MTRRIGQSGRPPRLGEVSPERRARQNQGIASHRWIRQNGTKEDGVADDIEPAAPGARRA